MASLQGLRCPHDECDWDVCSGCAARSSSDPTARFMQRMVPPQRSQHVTSDDGLDTLRELQVPLLLRLLQPACVGLYLADVLCGLGWVVPG
jgi:hypothetical protein